MLILVANVTPGFVQLDNRNHLIFQNERGNNTRFYRSIQQLCLSFRTAQFKKYMMRGRSIKVGCSKLETCCQLHPSTRIRRLRTTNRVQHPSFPHFLLFSLSLQPKPRAAPQLDNQQSYTLLPVQRRSFQLEANLQNGDYQPPNTLPGEDTHAFSPNMIGEQYSYISSRSISQIRTSVRSANTARVLLLCPTVPIWSVSANASAPPTGTSDHRSRAHCSGWDPELLSQQSSIKLHLQMPNIPKKLHLQIAKSSQNG
ncbi:hypothetical protein BLNAU_22549 [Blattamonas nauphoetae]|uniref:Uncharacterized protein n=1 Tax=Blattamonas nauphoetae TaxID=2049346 RepID=A0ABQ9WST8_9EUKA|nr:hypothetical protein BLNAU_22549 [Blattamonas nauphoetae]